jgi:hypothetical protein
MMNCADDDGPTFHAQPLVYPIEDFYRARKAYEMSRQLLEFDEEEHDRTGGPTPYCPTCGERDCVSLDLGLDGTPLQEQVEQADHQINLLETAVEKAVDVIEALVKERQDQADQIYQAQLDAQDWQNRYIGVANRGYSSDQQVEITELNRLLEEAEDYIKDREALFDNLRDTYNEECAKNPDLDDQLYAAHTESSHLSQQILDLTHGPGITETEQLKRDLERSVLTNQEYYARIKELTDKNAELEVELESLNGRLDAYHEDPSLSKLVNRQATMLFHARQAAASKNWANTVNALYGNFT